MRKIIIQHATSEQKPIIEAVKPKNKAYADKFGFEYITDSKIRAKGRLYYWEKIAYMQALLPKVEDGSLVVWEDADSVNVGDESFESALPDGFVFGMVQIRGGLGCSQLIPAYNSGVMVLINSPLTRDFLQRAWDRDGRTDEDAIVAELKHSNFFIGDGKPVFSLDPKWNCWMNNEHLCKNPVVRSFHGVKLEDKLEAVKAIL